MLTHEQVEASLHEQLRTTRVAYLAAREEFDRVTKVPTDLPAPDGVQSIKQAGSAHTFALRAYTQALKEFNHFVIAGTVPERFTSQQSQKANG